MKIKLIGSLILSLLATCVHETKGPAVSLDKINADKPISENATQRIAALKSALEMDENRHLAPLMKDIEHILDAQRLEEINERTRASESWLRAMKEAQKPFARFVFESWFLNYVKILDNPKDLNLLTILVLKETANGAKSSYMKTRNLNISSRLLPVLRKILVEKNYSSSENESKSNAMDNSLPAPLEPGIPSDDRQLKKTASEYCRSGSPNSYQWDAWLRTLSIASRDYWTALILQCEGKELQSIKFLKNSAHNAQISHDQNDHPIAIAAYESLVRVLRFNSSRDEAADYYLDLMKAWSLPGLNQLTLRKTPYEISVNHIDDALWAARYRALVGDHQNAKIFVNDAIQLISIAHNQATKLNMKVSRELGEFKAEAYHILSFRIALERNEFSRAAALSIVGLEIPHLSQEWTERFLWYLGLYEYFDGRITEARTAWSKLLRKTKDPEIKAKALFWLANAFHKTGNLDKTQELLALLSKNHPLDFYNIVAPAVSQLRTQELWKEVFPPTKKLEQKLNEMADYDLSPLRSDQKLSKTLAKTELLLFAGLNDLAKIPSDYLYSRARKTVRMNKDPEAFIYLSRLLYAVGNYKKAISISFDLSIRLKNFWTQWPEQLLIYYPQAFSSTYNRNAKEQTVEPSILYAISRQESLFDSKALSPANAVGLMQLIKPTAERMSHVKGQKWTNIKNRLDDPEVNIMLGSTYVKVLKHRYGDNLPAVLASYNAGEYAVDAWLKRRSHVMPLLWVELIPFGETRGYVKKVWRNQVVYQHLSMGAQKVSVKPRQLRVRRASIDSSSKPIR